MPQPTALPVWDTNEINTIQPDISRQDNGWLNPGGIPERPSFQVLNWWMNNVYKWVKHYDDNVSVDDLGNVQFTQYGAGTLTTDASGNITAASDRNMKEGFEELSDEEAIDIVNSFEPTYFYWKTETGLNDMERELGFIAQDVHEKLPEAGRRSIKKRKELRSDAKGKELRYLQESDYKTITEEKWGININAVVAAQHKVIKNLLKRVEVLEGRIK